MCLLQSAYIGRRALACCVLTAVGATIRIRFRDQKINDPSTSELQTSLSDQGSCVKSSIAEAWTSWSRKTRRFILSASGSHSTDRRFQWGSADAVRPSGVGRRGSWSRADAILSPTRRILVYSRRHCTLLAGRHRPGNLRSEPGARWERKNVSPDPRAICHVCALSSCFPAQVPTARAAPNAAGTATTHAATRRNAVRYASGMVPASRRSCWAAVVRFVALSSDTRQSSDGPDRRGECEASAMDSSTALLGRLRRVDEARCTGR